MFSNCETRVKEGYSLIVYNRSTSAIEELTSKGAKKANSLQELAEQADIIFTMLPDSPDVEKVISGEKGILSGIKEGSIIVDMSSITPLVSRELANKAAHQGIEMLDAPVSGGEPKAIDGTLSFMIGGSEIAFEQVKPILAVMGNSIIRVGESGSGQVAKLANQMIVGLNIAGLSEAMVLAQKSGVTPENVFYAIRDGLAGSTVMDAKAPMILNRDFQPGFRLELHAKDIKNALDTAHDFDSPTTFTSQLYEIMEILKSKDHGRDDHSGIIQFFEQLAEVEVHKTDSK